MKLTRQKLLSNDQVQAMVKAMKDANLPVKDFGSVISVKAFNKIARKELTVFRAVTGQANKKLWSVQYDPNLFE